MNTPTRRALELGIGPNEADVRRVVGMVGGGEKKVVQVSSEELGDIAMFNVIIMTLNIERNKLYTCISELTSFHVPHVACTIHVICIQSRSF